jgi:hypothetical protein
MHRCKRLWLRLSVRFWRFRFWLQQKRSDVNPLELRVAMFVLASHEVCLPGVHATEGEIAQAKARLLRLASDDF